MNSNHVVETQNKTPIVEHKEHSFLQYILPVSILLIIMFGIFMLNKNMIAKPPTQPSPTPLPATYTCPPPETEYIDCMPGPGEPKPECDPEYLEWARKNCEGFQGGAF